MINKNNKFKLIKAITMSSIAFVTFSTPALISSCSFNISEGNLSLNEQIELLKGSKQQVFDFWLSRTYASWFVNNVLKETDKKQEKSEEIVTYLATLKWDHAIALSNESRKKVEDQILDNFKFYIDYKSNIQDASLPNTLPNDYWNDQAAKWKTEELTTITSESLIDLDLPRNWNSSFFDLDKDKFMNNFRLLFLARGTQVFQEIMKMCIIEIYFVNSQESQIRLATNYTKLEKKLGTKENIEATSFDIKKEDYNLVKYLVDNAPSLQWNISNDTIEQPSINTLDDFNNLTLVGNTVSNTILPKTNDNVIINTEPFNLSMLRSYKGFTTETGSGDLATGYSNIKLFNSPKVGLFDKQTNQLFSFQKLAARKQISEDIQLGSQIRALPFIKLKEEEPVFKKSVDEIKLSDIDAGINIPGTTITTSLDTELKKLTLEDKQNQQKWIIHSIKYADQKNDNKNIILDVDYIFEVNDKTMKYSYEATISNWSYSSSTSQSGGNVYTQVARYEKQFNFIPTVDNIEIYKLHPESISVLSSDDPTKTNISYYQKILPIFNVTSSRVLGGEFIQLGKFSLDLTIWNSIEQKKQLSRIFALSDTTLWAKVQDYLLFNNFNLKPTISELQAIVKELGLNEKTQEDRKKAGIE